MFITTPVLTVSASGAYWILCKYVPRLICWLTDGSPVSSLSCDSGHCWDPQTQHGPRWGTENIPGGSQ